jgi:hypothetical protein
MPANPAHLDRLRQGSGTTHLDDVIDAATAGELKH